MSRSASLFRRLSMALVFVFLYAPILVLIVFSFNDSSSRSVWAGFTLDWYRELLRDDLILDAFYTTLAVSVLAAVIATVAGTFAAIGFYNMKRRWRGPLMTINNIPMVNADIVTGVSMCLFFVAAFSLWGQAAEWINASLGTDLPTKLYLGFGTMLIAHITFNIPYVILSVMPKLRQLDPNIFEAAQDLGATGWYAFRKVILPEILPGVLNGALIAFTMSIDDFVISYFTAGSGANTLSMVVYSMVRRRISPEINALSTLMFVVVIALMILINVRQSRQDRRTQAAIRAERRADLRP